jgi:hypothetical protein
VPVAVLGCDGAEVTRAGLKVQARCAHHGGRRRASLVHEFGGELEARGWELGRNLAAERTGGSCGWRAGARAWHAAKRRRPRDRLGGSGCACFAVKPAAALPAGMPVLL